jgi:hypothetical protein
MSLSIRIGEIKQVSCRLTRITSAKHSRLNLALRLLFAGACGASVTATGNDKYTLVAMR